MKIYWNRVWCPKFVCNFLIPELSACLHFYIFWGQSIISALFLASRLLTCLLHCLSAATSNVILGTLRVSDAKTFHMTL